MFLKCADDRPEQWEILLIDRKGPVQQRKHGIVPIASVGKTDRHMVPFGGGFSCGNVMKLKRKDENRAVRFHMKRQIVDPENRGIADIEFNLVALIVQSRSIFNDF